MTVRGRSSLGHQCRGGAAPAVGTPPEQKGPDAAFSLCHTHSAITFGPGGGGGGQNLKRRPRTETGLLSGLEFHLLLVVS